MSKMKYDRKPPLAKSPVRLRPRRAVKSNSISLQTPPGSLTKSQKPNPLWDSEEPDLKPEYRSVSCELRALARMVKDELAKGEPKNRGGANNLSADSSSVFQRGRFYDEYSARRNERLKRKKGEMGDDIKTPAFKLGVTVESSKRRDTKKLESLRKSVCTAYSVERSEQQTQPRYMLRSMSKENKKPPLAGVYIYEKSALATDRKSAIRRVRKM